MPHPFRIPLASCVLGVVAALTVSAPASADPVAVTWDCQAQPPVGGPQQLNLDTPITGSAPASVATGSDFEIAAESAPLTIPTSAGGNTIRYLKNLQVRTPVPAGTALRGVTLTGGSNLGTGVPSTSVANGVVTLTVPGPVTAGATIQLPTIHLAVTATAPAGATITSTVAGTSYADPGLTFTANVKILFGGIDVPARCYTAPSPVLTSTAVTE
ncbi:cyclodehydratase [Krasilnikovia sp. MM14-A1004]|uniref:cyclodehydratase n=1 Tax=Krasilnikovia sp. MM14-A1004 TaxID=3373541 RepID=UPI00399CC044